MRDVLITGSGVYTPADTISNDELVTSYNLYVDSFNATHEQAIKRGEKEALAYSDAAFIEKASGIRSRYVIDKEGILDNNYMHPLIPEREDDELSLQAEMAVEAAKKALVDAGRKPEEVDAVIFASSEMQRAYPAMSIEVQGALGIQGFAFDMNVACSSVTFAIQMAKTLVSSQAASVVLIVNPEISTGHINFKNRDGHFIFGDAATALVLEASHEREQQAGFKIASVKLFTEFSNNIRNNGGFMTRLTPGADQLANKLFYQNGRKVFKEVTLEVLAHLKAHLKETCLQPDNFKRLWLHQANYNMNRLIAKKFLGREVDEDIAPTILDEYANTASAGAIIAFHNHHDNLSSGDLALICSFGAGYSIGSVILEKV